MRKIVCFPIKCYQYFISPWVGQRCRFHPTCSHYAIEALSQCGVVKGVFLSTLRLLRCHPFAKGGYDPVLSNKEKI